MTEETGPKNETEKLEEQIREASEVVGSAWPLHSFVTANPLSGFEDEPFHDAVRNGSKLFGGDGYPSPSTLKKAWESGRIDTDILVEELRRHGYDESPEKSLKNMKEEESVGSLTYSSDERLDRIVTKWLSSFCDQGRAEASMPHREKGFYEAFRRVAKHDPDIPKSGSLSELPDEPAKAILSVVSDIPESDRTEVFEYHLCALPGWVGFIKQRSSDPSVWQEEYPIDLTEYLAVRLAVADLIGSEISLPSDVGETPGEKGVPLQEVWLKSWERTYREEILPKVKESAEELTEDAKRTDDGRPEAQLVFCIDTRSEIIRRAVEETGEYETHGYAGFFGIPMEYDAYETDVTFDACPPIVDPAHRIEETTTDGCHEGVKKRSTWKSLKKSCVNLIKTMETNVATAYSYVETFGALYGVTMTARTLLPSMVYDATETVGSVAPKYEDVYEPSFERVEGENGLPRGLTKDEMADYADSAFSLMGWGEFGRLVVFAGHAGQTQNNPFDSALDCGACAGNPGGPSARVLASICNDDEVKDILRGRGHDIPEDTVFVAGQHNTTTDEVELFASDVPESHEEDIESLREDLKEAREIATEERAQAMDENVKNPVREVKRRAGDWAETRPEWGLAGNAAFVIGPRELTDGIDLGGRSFLHSYDWSTDSEGDALEAIMQGPMVVTQWINSQYYFATVDNSVYGSGSKVTQNPVGNVGVYQGNGGDIMTGLPLQSLYLDETVPYHQPIRLTTVIHAPVERVEGILEENPSLASLLDNGWLSLTVIDPENDNRVFHYEEGVEWEPEDEKVEAKQKVSVSGDD